MERYWIEEEQQAERSLLSASEEPVGAVSKRAGAAASRAPKPTAQSRHISHTASCRGPAAWRFPSSWIVGRWSSSSARSPASSLLSPKARQRHERTARTSERRRVVLVWQPGKENS